MVIQNIRDFLHGKYFKKNRRPEMITDLNYNQRPSLNGDYDIDTIRNSISLSFLYPVFTMSLDDAVRLNSNYTQTIFEDSLCLPELQCHVPIIVLKLIDYITKYGLTEEGIYRISGSTASIRLLKKRFIEEGPTFELTPEEYDIHTITSLLKLYLRELPIDILKVSNENEELKYVPEEYSSRHGSTTAGLGVKFGSINSTNRPVIASGISPSTLSIRVNSISENSTTITMNEVNNSPSNQTSKDISDTANDTTNDDSDDSTHDSLIHSRPITPLTPSTVDLNEVPDLCPSSPDSQHEQELEPQTPISCSNTFDPCYTVMMKDKSTPINLVRNELMQSRVSHFALLHVMTRHLALVAANSDKNRMPIPNLVLIFSATLRMHKLLLTELITKGNLTYEDISFGEHADLIKDRIVEIEPSVESELKGEDELFIPKLSKEDFRRMRKKSGIRTRSRATSFDFFDPGFFRTRVQST